MPYSRRRTNRRYPKKRYTKRRTNTWGSMAAKALKTANYVARLINAESKYFETNSTGITPTYNGTYISLCTPAQGAGASAREGDSIKLKNFTFRGQLVNNAATESVRLIVVLDKENKLSTGSDLLRVTGDTTAIFSDKNIDNKYDNKILWDKTFHLDSTNHTSIPIKFTLKLGFHTHFVATTNTITNNALKIFIISQAATNSPLFRYNTITTYVDN
jgi:hypothetical protein